MAKTYFISGHLNISKNEWIEHYKEKIDNAIKEKSNFILGDARGADLMSMEYLKNNNIENVIIYHIYNKPLNNVGYPTKGNFKSHSECDKAMTNDSDYDIAWVRPEHENKILYGENYKPNKKTNTELNLLRRYNKMSNNNKIDKRNF